LLEKIEGTDLRIPSYKSSSSGKINYKLKSLSGTSVSEIGLPIDLQLDIQGTELNIDYKINTQQKKMEAAYNLLFNQDSYNGYIYLNNDNFIITTDILSKINEACPSCGLTGAEDLPEYAYYNDESIGQMWDMWENNIYNGEDLPPEFKDLLVFIIEAVPEKCFSTSLVNQKITINMNEDDIADFISSIMQKAVNEPDRFATIISGLGSAIDPTQDRETLKNEILEGLQYAKQNGLPTSDKVKSIMAELVSIEEFKIEMSMLPYGDSSFHMAASIKE